MSFGDIPTTTRDFWDGALSDIVWQWGVTGGFFSSVAGVLDRHPNFIIYLVVWLLYYIIFWIHYRSVDDTRVYVFICKYVQTGVICWVEEGPKCNVMLTINFLYIYIFSRMNGSAGRWRGWNVMLYLRQLFPYFLFSSFYRYGDWTWLRFFLSLLNLQKTSLN